MPLVVIAAIGAVHHAHRVGLQNAVILEGGAAGSDVGLIPLRQGNGHPQRDQAEFAGLQAHFLGGTQIDPVGFACHIAELFHVFLKIFYLDFFHVKLQN